MRSKRKSDLKHWVNSTSSTPLLQPYHSDDELNPSKMSSESGDPAIDPLQQWDQFLELADRSINSSSTKARLDFYHRQGRKAASLDHLEPQRRVELLSLLLATYAKYIDRDSRLASLQLAHQLISIDEAHQQSASPPANGPAIKYAVAWLKREAERICKPASTTNPAAAAAPLSTRAALHAWVSKVFTLACETAAARQPPARPESLPVWEPLVQLLALTYDSVLAHDAVKAKLSIRNNVVALTRRTLRNCQAQLPALFASLTASPAGAAALRAVSLLGEAVAVSIRLRVGSEQTKGAPDGVGRGYVRAAKASILSFYSTQLVASKVAVPPQALNALADFIANEVTEDDIVGTLRPQLEKMLLRSPEVALPVASGLFEAYRGDAGLHTKPLLSSTVSASRSTNALTRAKALDFFKVLTRKTSDGAALSALVDEILAMLKGGKAATPEARASLYAMLSSVEPGEHTRSAAIVETISSMLAKEFQEPSMHAGVQAVCRHLCWSLQQDIQPAAAVSQSLNKELQNAKIPLRKAVCTAVGELFWDAPSPDKAEPTAAAKAFAESLLPGLEANLKAASTNTLTAAGGPLEGYVAVSILEGPLSTWGSAKISSTIEKNAVLQTIVASSPKPSFVLNEKVIKKLSMPDEEIWLLRALQALVERKSRDFERDEPLRIAAAYGFIHVLLHGSAPASRRLATVVVEELAASHALLVNTVVREGAFAYLHQSKEPAPAKSSSSTAAATAAAADGDDGAASQKNYGRELRRLLQAASTFPEGLSVDDRQRALIGLLVLSHHPDLLDHGTTSFMDLCFRAKVLPIDLVTAKLQDLLAALRSAIDDPKLAEAGYAGMATLARMSPDEVMAELVSAIESDIQCDEIAHLTQEELGIWRTEPGTLFVDVLAANKEPTNERAKKDNSVEAWEAEIREQIARKKAAASKTLTKDQKAAVDAQTKVEAATRARVEELRQRLVRSLKTVSSLVGARAEELQGYMQSLVNLTIDVLRVPQATLLVGAEAKEAFWALSSCTSTRLDIYAMFVGVAILRMIDDELVGEDLRQEPILDLVQRILYRLRTLSEQAPLDPGSVAFINPIIVAIVQAGGLGVQTDDTDSVLEQIQLALDFISFHGSACEDVRYPRSSFIDSLVHIVAKHSQIAKDAVAALRDLGEAIRTSTLPHELHKLLGNTMVDEVYVRNGCLQAIQSLDLTDLEFPAELWLACHDEDENNARLAEKAWEENALDVPVDFAATLIPLLEHKNAYVRQSCARALAEATRAHPEQVTTVINQLCTLYRDRNKPLAPEYDRFGMVIESTMNREDPWKTRAAIAHALKYQAEFFQGSDIAPFFEFLIAGQALGDRNDDVREKMLDTASTVIDLHGADHISELISMFEAFFAHPAATSDDNDGVTEAVVILLGREARHLAATDGRISEVVDRLINALKTPSELVQSAVADCLPPLRQAISKDVPRLFDQLFDQLFHGAKYAERRGAAYGLAGLVMGRGIGSIREFKVMRKLSSAVSEKSATTRQGAMFAFETLTITLKTLFEPYIAEILPHLLAGYGDGSADVREATEDASRAIMQTVSGHCIKMILPTLLEGLEEKQWRTKKGAIELLGAMAYCAPRQLSMSLPTVIPRLSEVLTDSHTQVRTSANKSLKQFGEVISNPEIKDLVPILLKALIDPNTKTPAALKGLLETSFVHYIDSPSLALLVPIIDRGLKERSASVQQNAARIVGNLAGLTDSKDFVPYLNKLIPMVRVVLVSPVPEARAVAAKALGTLVERLGEVHFVDLVPSLLQVLRSNATGVDRQGAAQGLAEVLSGLGMERMENLLPEIINSATSARAYVREGHISLLIYLPATFGHRFAPHLGRIIPPILGGIADETESVREASMRAGRMIVANYSSKAVDLLLPHLEQGLFDESWRIRISSLQLVADLLFRLSGISGKNEVEQDEADENNEAVVANNSVQRALVEALGQERRDKILASIYIVRQDPNIPVRQAAIHTWKALVHNTPRTAREVLPTMLDILIKSLASNGDENREMAARTLGELVKKLGEKILRETIPVLRMRGATSDDAKTRSGVCFAVTEVLANSTKSQLEDHEDAIIAVVRHALVDESQMVRHAAAQAFDATQQYIGSRAIDETIPTLLEALSDTSGGTSETALAALHEVMRARADVVFPVLVPTLIAQPVSSFNARALAVLVKVAGAALNCRLSNILTALSKALQTEKDETVMSDLEAAVEAIFASISDVDGLHQTMIQLLGWAGSNVSPQQRVAGCRFFKTFCNVKRASIDLSDYMVDWLRKLVTLFDDPVPEVVEAAWEALDACFKTVSKEDMEGLVVPLRRTLENVGAPGKNLAGLCRAKGAGPLVPVFLAGLMNGTAEQRQYGALGLSDIVERTSPEAIKPFVTSMIGPLIRLCGDRHPPPVKAAILTSLDTMVRHIPALVRPFYPQLQRSYQKAVSDVSSNTVRSRAGVALGSLMALQARVDPVILELVQGARSGFVGGGGGDEDQTTTTTTTTAAGASAEMGEIADSFAQALARVLANAPGKNVGSASRVAILDLLESAFEASGKQDLKDAYKHGVAEVVGSLVKLDGDLARRALNSLVLCGAGRGEYDASLQSLSVRAALERDVEALHALGVADEVVKTVVGWTGEASSVSRPAKESREIIKECAAWRDEAKNADWI